MIGCAPRDRRLSSYTFILAITIIMGAVIFPISPPVRPSSSFEHETGVSSTVPGKPTIISAIAQAYSINLTWTIPYVEPHDPLFFELYWGYSAGSCSYWECDLGYYGCPSSVDYRVTGLVQGVTYYYRVRASNSQGSGPWSDAASATTPNPPGAPTGLTATGSNGKVSLHWTGPAYSGTYPITNYWVYRGTSPGTKTRLAIIGNQWSWDDTSVVNGNWYYYTVYAVSSAGAGASSDDAAARPVGPPRAPQNLTIQASSGSGYLTWAAPVSDGGLAITNYTIYRRTIPPSVLIATVANVTSYLDSGLTNGVSYFYTIKAVNSAGEGQSSYETWLRPGKPSSVQDLNVTGGYGKIVLSWIAPLLDGGHRVTSYKIYRGNAFDEKILIATIGIETTYVDTAVEIDRKYYYLVTAVNDVMEGDESITVAASASLDPLVIPFSIGIVCAGVILLLGLLRVRARKIEARRAAEEAEAKQAARRAIEEAEALKRAARKKARDEDTRKAVGVDVPQPTASPIKKNAAVKRATASAPSTNPTSVPVKDSKPTSCSNTQPKDKSGYSQNAVETGTPVNRTVLKEYIERKRKEGARELHYIQIKTDLNVISQKKSAKLYRILQGLVDDEILVRKGSNYVIVG
jgi:fibronectin type 3 domain-containing protein